MPDMHQPPSRPDEPDTVEPTADEQVEAIPDEDTGAELGEVSGGGEVTDLAGDSPSS
jgi:hypothetical protein